jgi:hypothetical protein
MPDTTASSVETVEKCEPVQRSTPVTAPSWCKEVKKTIYTLNIGDYAPEVCALTYPLMQAYAKKIGADFHVIRERKYPDWPVVYEKLQIFELGRKHRNDWNIFLDGDTLVHPEMFDVTEHLDKDTVCHNGTDMAGIRWKYDHYFRRDGRNIGSCNWFTIASDWCLDLWRPLEDLSLDEAVANINITISEMNSGFCSTPHLIDDYTLSRNIARFGLKVKTVVEIGGHLGFRNAQGNPASPFLYHKYTIPNEQKAREMVTLLTTPAGQPGPVGFGWGVMNHATATEYRRRFGMQTDQRPRAGRTEPAVSPGSDPLPEPGSHIQGWMGSHELRWLHQTARELGSVVEIGCWKGRSTFALCSSGCPRVVAVELAHQRYLRVHPDHRLVADSLEADWNRKLCALQEAQQQYERESQKDRLVVDEELRTRLHILATDFPRLWRDPNTPDRERKRLARLLLEDVTLMKKGQILVHIRFPGGTTRTLELPIPTNPKLTPPAVVAEIDRLLDHHTSKAIADCLNSRGFTPGYGKPFHGPMVARIAKDHGLKTRWERLRQRGMLTLEEMGKRLGIGTDQVKAWRSAGLLHAYLCNDKNEYLYEDPGPTPPRVGRGAKLPRKSQISENTSHHASEVQCEA